MQASDDIRAVIFDLDDTLLSASAVKWAHFKAAAFNEYGLSVDDEVLRALWGRPLLEQVNHIFGSVDTAENVYAKLTATVAQFPKTALDGAVDAVAGLLDAGLIVGVITSAPGSYACDDLIRLGFSVERMAFVHGEEDVPVHKPDPLVFEPALMLLGERGLTRQNVVYVGDLLADFEAAQAAQLHFVGVTTGLVTEAEFRKAGASVVLPGVADAARFIDVR